MKFGLQSDIPDRALPEALRSLIVQQTEALVTLLQYAQDTSDAIQANKDITAHEKAQRLTLLADETSQRLGALEHKNVEMERQIGEFQGLVRQQGNPLLGYMLDRVEVMERNFVRMRDLEWDVPRPDGGWRKSG